MSNDSSRPTDTSSGTRTVTINGTIPSIKLRGAHSTDSEDKTTAKPQVKWEETVVDNEHLNKKKSKICCIFHPQDLDSDEEEEHAACNHDHEHESDESSSSSDEDDNEDDFETRRQKRLERRMKKLEENSTMPYKPSNAYEIQPDYSHLRSKQ